MDELTFDKTESTGALPSWPNFLTHLTSLINLYFPSISVPSMWHSFLLAFNLFSPIATFFATHPSLFHVDITSPLPLYRVTSND